MRERRECLHYQNIMNRFFVRAAEKRAGCKWEEAAADGVAPENYHSTSMYPEYFKINGKWMLPEKSRMDSSVVYDKDGTLKVVGKQESEKRRPGDPGKNGKGRRGDLSSHHRFENPEETQKDQFVFRQGRSRRLLMPETMTGFLNC